MGKSRATKKKRIAETLLVKNPDVFTTNFEENKKILNELVIIPSKQLRNNVVGYLTRAMHEKQKQTI